MRKACVQYDADGNIQAVVYSENTPDVTNIEGREQKLFDENTNLKGKKLNSAKDGLEDAVKPPLKKIREKYNAKDFVAEAIKNRAAFDKFCAQFFADVNKFNVQNGKLIEKDPDNPADLSGA